MALDENTKKQIDDLVKGHKVLLFMKGNKSFPQCGFSATVVGILKELQVPFESVNILADHALREGIKAYSEWPTIPQLYVDGEFVGGCDIVREMHATGELAKLVGAKYEPPKPPNLTITDAAARAFADAAEPGDTELLRLEVAPSFAVDLYFGPPKAGDFKVESNGIVVLVDPASAKRADGVRIDYVDGPDGAGFKIDNPNEPPRVRQVPASELQSMMDKGEVHVFDVRPDHERALASIAGTIALDDGGEEKLAALDKATPIAFVCHHGVRSQTAAQHYLGKGYQKVFNLQGGIEAWSATVDPSVPRY